jgi:serine protease Do
MLTAASIRLSVVLALLLAILSQGRSQAAELSLQQLYERTAPAVVMVMGLPAAGKQGNAGTGSIVGREGMVLTNAHVVIDEHTGKPYPNLMVYFKPERVTGNPRTDLARGRKASVVAASGPLDLALLKVEGGIGSLPTLELTDSNDVKIGDHVAAIGHPEQGGLWTLTTGVVSAEFVDFNDTKGKDVFQTETGLNRGNSGGPLLNHQGHIVGINTAIARVAPDGMPITSISFSVKSNVARTWLREQGIGSDTTARPSEPPKTASQAIQPQPSPAQTAPQPTQPSSPSAKATAPQIHTPARPYNLDQVLSDRAKAEAYMDDMMREMRGKFRQ